MKKAVEERDRALKWAGTLKAAMVEVERRMAAGTEAMVALNLLLHEAKKDLEEWERRALSGE